MLGLFSALLEALTKGATSGLKGLQSSLNGAVGVFAATSLAVSAILPTTASAATLLNNTALNLGNLAGSAAQTSLQVKQQTTSAVLSTSKLMVQAPLEVVGNVAPTAWAVWQGAIQVGVETTAGLGGAAGKAAGATLGAINPVNPFVPGTEGFNLPGGRGGGGGGLNPSFLNMQRATSNMMMQSQQSQMAAMAAMQASQNG